MPDPQGPSSETARTERQRGRQVGDHPGPLADAEPRSFQTAEEAAQSAPKAASAAAAAMGQATRELADRQQQATHEMTTSWRGAMEPFLALQAEMSRWLEERWRQATSLGVMPSLHAGAPFAWSVGPAFGLPAADVKETEQAYILCVELPGLTSEDLRLQVKGDVIILSGDKAEQREDTAGAFHLSERRFGRFERKFALPADADRSKIAAKFRDGVLTITLSKTASGAPVAGEIAIKAG